MSEDLVKRVLERCTESGAAQADVVLVHSEATEVRVRDREIDFVKQSRERILGIRALVKGDDGLRTAVTSTSDLTEGVALSLASDTVEIASATAADPFAGIPAEGFATDLPDLALHDPADRNVGVDQLIEAAREAEAAARAEDARIENSEGSEASQELVTVTYGNSEGFVASYDAAAHGLFSMPIAAANGEMQTDYWSTAARSRSALETPGEVGAKAARRAARRLGSQRVRTCEVPVVFDAANARSLVSHLTSCITGGAIYRKTSFLADALGEQVASPLVTITDDGRRLAGLGSKPFDGEGQATRKTCVISGGQLENFLLDSYAGRKLGRPSTGSAARSPGGRPGASATNIWLEPGEQSLEEIIAETPRGLYLTYLFGHGFNPTTGDLSRGAAGVWIENGELTHPVEEITIAGNLRDMLLGIDAVGDDVLWQSSVAAPSLRISNMTIAGE